MNGIKLTDEEGALRNQIEERLTMIFKMLDKHDQSYSPKMLDECGTWASKLHMLLKKRGLEPRHHKYMIKNRGLRPDQPGFYAHIHPIQDLLKYIADVHANDDPSDQTMGHQFEFRVFSRRWGHDDLYQVTRTSTGWDIRHLDGGPSDKAGKPSLYTLLDHDSINYPEELPGYMEWLWKQAAEQGLSTAEVQTSLQNLADWVSLCEKASPTGIFHGYK